MAKIISFDTGLTINMCEPTAAQLFCERYERNDGECSVRPGGCNNCPGKAYLAERHEARKAETVRKFTNLASSDNRLWTLMFVCLFGALGMIGFLAAANSGLSRVEHHYQMEARV